MKTVFNKQTLWATLGVLLLATLFVGASIFATEYRTEIEQFVNRDGFTGIILYILVAIIATVIAPISAFPLIPLASMMWGWFWSAIFAIIGWAVGGQIAFWISRYCGKPLVSKLVPIKKLSEYEDTLPEKNLFLTVIFLRIILPVDILSYALGLFTRMKSSHFWWATVIGVTPFAFVFAYAGTMSVRNQIFILIEVLAFVVFATYMRKKYLEYKKKKSPTEVRDSSSKHIDESL